MPQPMSSSLIPEKPLLVSPSLAATIGLEEALMVQALHDLAAARGQAGDDGFRWLKLPVAELFALFPFWLPQDCERVASSLRDKGVLLIESPPLNQATVFCCALNETERAPSARPRQARKPDYGRGRTLIAGDWQPDEQILRQLEMNQVPRQFAVDQVGEFIAYWRERGEGAFSWGSKFRAQVMRRWREQQSGFEATVDVPEAMHRDWQASADALDILEKGGIPRDFALDAIPEFVLYWAERGDIARTWNSRFLTHVKRQWMRCTQSLGADGEATLMQPDWTPLADVYDILQLANIETGFARQLLPEFVLYWRERGEVSSSWNSKFLQFIKHQWARRHRLAPATEDSHEEGQDAAGKRSTRSRSLAEDLSDHSWAG